MINVGIIGAGRIGQVHARSILTGVPDARIKAIADPYLTEQARDWAQSAGIEHIYTDYRKILEDETIGAVLICSSTDTHAQISIEAAKKGKHIFCEKPIDQDVSKIEAVLEAVEAAGIKYQVGFNRRFDKHFKHVREVVAKGGVGEVQIVKVTSRDPQAPPVSYVKTSGGIFADMTIHDFDMVRYLSGSEVAEVSVFGACLTLLKGSAD